MGLAAGGDVLLELVDDLLVAQGLHGQEHGGASFGNSGTPSKGMPAMPR